MKVSKIRRFTADVDEALAVVVRDSLPHSLPFSAIRCAPVRVAPTAIA
jgi:hypothetical protein